MRRHHLTASASVRPSIAVLALLALGACSGTDGTSGANAAPPAPTTPSASSSVPDEAPALQPTESATTAPGEIIAYAGGESPGYLVQSRSDARSMTEAPAAFRGFIGRAADKLTRSATCEDAAVGITVEFVSSAGWAVGGVNECGGYRAIWGTVDGDWQQVLGTQDAYDCAVLRSYQIPSDVVGGRCYDYQAQEQEKYRQA